MNAPHDLLTLLERMYDVEQDRDAWLTGLARAAAQCIDVEEPRGAGAILYDVTESRGVRVDGFQTVDTPAGWREQGLQTHSDPRLAPSIRMSYRMWLFGTFQELSQSLNHNARALATSNADAAGIADQLLMNGGDSSGIGCCIHLFAARPMQLSARRRAMLSRITTHLATAYRLQRRLAAPGGPAPVEAVLEPKGSVAHAEPEAQSSEARASLGEAVRMREWARGRARKDDSARAVWAWRGLVSRRWTLVDQVESDGRRYVLARENRPSPRGVDALSAREREVASLAALGRSNKLIAYELGLASSTVRVLMSRAAAKVGARSRTELVARIRASD